VRPWGRAATSVRPAEVNDCDILSEIHATAFRRGWSEAEFEALLVQPGTCALIADHRGPFGRRTPAGFILYRLVVDEAEILSVAVRPQCRRRGIGRVLLEEALRHLFREGAHMVHLEVEDNNLSAISLYGGMEFHESGRRAGYYRGGRESATGALVMLRQLR
jgi:ribosomal-protein-alanine N-acetyltransferase